MHNVFSFPLVCNGVGFNRWDRMVVFEEYRGETAIRGSGYKLEFYNPFNCENLIPDFINLIEKISNGGDLENYLKKWHSEWGPLHSNYKNQTVEKFSEEALRFYKLWNFYKAIANSDEEAIMDHIKIEKDFYEGGDDYYITFFSEDNSFKEDENPIRMLNEQIGKKIFRELRDPQYNFSISREDAENMDLTKYQMFSILFLFKQIEKYTANAYLGHSNIIANSNDFSKFKIRPALYVDNLIDAIYLQFFILFSENEKKICVNCNTPFVPERKDKKYCSDSCKLTAKSRRYRSRKNKKA